MKKELRSYEELRILRESLGYSRENVAKLLDVSRQTITTMEQYETQTTKKSPLLIAYNVIMDSLIQENKLLLKEKLEKEIFERQEILKSLQ